MNDTPSGHRPERNASRRKSDRVRLAAEVSLRRAGSINYRVGVFDLSTQGCKAEFVERPNVGESVWIRFDGLEALEAVVRWVAGCVVGLEFRRPIHVAVFDALIADSHK